MTLDSLRRVLQRSSNELHSMNRDNEFVRRPSLEHNVGDDRSAVQQDLDRHKHFVARWLLPKD